MPNYAPYVIILLDSILLSTLSQQLWFRYRIYRKYKHIEVVREQVVHKRKDIYRVVIGFVLFIKTCYSFCWLLYQGWATYNLQEYIKPWFFWIFYGGILSICFLIKGDFASVVVTIEQNISDNGKKKVFWRGVLMGSAVLSSIICLWGIVLSINIRNTPIWQYIGFSTSILNGFITYKMLTSIISTTRETQASTYHVRPSITAKEFEKQLFTLFHMKQMVVALIFIAIHAIYTFIINLYHIITGEIILQPFIGNNNWYLYSKLIIWNLYIYSIIVVVLIYTWISYTAIREAAIKAKRKDTLTTPDNPENDIVIMPDTLEMIYPPNIDPNDPDNLYNGGDITDTDDHYNVLYPNVSRRNSYNPNDQQRVHQHIINNNMKNNINLQPIETNQNNNNNICYNNNNNISNNCSPISQSIPISPGSKLSVLSHTNTIDNNNNNNNNNIGTVTDIIPIFGHKISIKHRAESSLATDINIDGFINESHKRRPHTTMFDMNILSMQKRGCSLERIYFDAQKYRGITPKSLKITAKMRSVSYSSRNITRIHSRRNTYNNKNKSLLNNSNVNTPSISISKKTNNLIYAKSVPDILPKNDNNNNNNNDDELSISYNDSLNDNNNNNNKPNVHINSKYNTINITVPEDAVLTPDKDHTKSNVFHIKNTNNTNDIDIINENKQSELNSSHSSILNDDNDEEIIMPNNIQLSKIKINSNSTVIQ